MKKKIFFVILLIVILIVGVFAFLNFGTKKVLMNEKAEGKNLVVTFTEFEKPIDDLGKGSYTMGGGSYEYTKPGYVNRLAHFTVDLKTQTGKTLLANAITLTPGTITVNIDGNHFAVHCLDKSIAVGMDSSSFVKVITKLENLRIKE